MEPATKERLVKELLTTGCLKLVEALKEEILKEYSDTKDIAIVGVPYGVVPVAAVVAYELKTTYIPVRKEANHYGNKAECDLLADHKSTGSSIVETIEKLDGKKVTDVIVVVNREAGGDENIKAACPDIKVYSIVRASEILEKGKK